MKKPVKILKINNIPSIETMMVGGLVYSNLAGIDMRYTILIEIGDNEYEVDYDDFNEVLEDKSGSG